MRLRRLGVLAFAVSLAGAEALAGPSFRCSLKPISGTAWIPGRVKLDFTDDLSRAAITDLAFGVTVRAKVGTHSRTSYVLNWSMPSLAVQSAAGQPRPRFRAVFNTSNQKMSVQALLNGSDESMQRGVGRCQRERNLSQVVQSEG